MQEETQEQSASQNGSSHDVDVIASTHEDAAWAAASGEEVSPAPVGATPPMRPSNLYAVGRLEARFPRLSVEKEFAQAAGRAETAGQTDQETFSKVLSKPENRYLARELCSPNGGLLEYVNERSGAHFRVLLRAARA